MRLSAVVERMRVLHLLSWVCSGGAVANDGRGDAGEGGDGTVAGKNIEATGTRRCGGRKFGGGD